MSRQLLFSGVPPKGSFSWVALRKFRKDCNKILRDSKFRARGTRNREPSVGKLLRSKSDQTKNVAKINMKYLDVDTEHYPHLAPDVCDRKCIKRCHSKGSASFVLLSLWCWGLLALKTVPHTGKFIILQIAPHYQWWDTWLRISNLCLLIRLVLWQRNKSLPQCIIIAWCPVNDTSKVLAMYKCI